MTEKDPAPEASGLTIIDASQVTEQEKAILALDMHEGNTVLKMSGGDVLPERIPVVDDEGNVVAVYAAEAPQTRAGAYYPIRVL